VGVLRLKLGLELGPELSHVGLVEIDPVGSQETIQGESRGRLEFGGNVGQGDPSELAPLRLTGLGLVLRGQGLDLLSELSKELVGVRVPLSLGSLSAALGSSWRSWPKWGHRTGWGLRLSNLRSLVGGLGCLRLSNLGSLTLSVRLRLTLVEALQLGEEVRH
jgi:hypothetical protein